LNLEPEPRTSNVTEFTRRVLAVVRRIPVGRVATYGDVARLAGRPRAGRAVGTIMRIARAPGVPCHRVVAAGGRLGGYGGREGLKRALLQAEGVKVVNGRIRGFAAARWSPAANRARPGRVLLSEATRVKHGLV
jgi:O-6-methylguanine DNA methyltransferase